MSNLAVPADPHEPYDIPLVADGFDHHPIVIEAVRSIYAFAMPGQEHAITRDQAQGVLRWWQHHDQLSEREVTAILARFPLEARCIQCDQPLNGPHADGCPLGPDFQQVS